MQTYEPTGPGMVLCESGGGYVKTLGAQAVIEGQKQKCAILDNMVKEKQEEIKAKEKQDYETRLFLLLNHGHAGVYTDDGELQCVECRSNWDYKRLPMKTLLCQFIGLKEAKLTAAREEIAKLRDFKDRFGNGCMNELETCPYYQMNEVAEAENCKLKKELAEQDKIDVFAQEIYADQNKEIAKLTNQLPEGMKDCKILFTECSVGHGYLQGENWLKKECPWCQIAKLTAERDEYESSLVETIGELIADTIKLTARLKLTEPHPFGDDYDAIDLLNARVKALTTSEKRLREALEDFKRLAEEVTRDRQKGNDMNISPSYIIKNVTEALNEADDDSTKKR